MVTTDQVKQLRDQTGVSVMQCKKALEDAQGDMEKALILLRKKGADIASKKGERTIGASTIASYVHQTGTVAAMVELSAETDFVAKNEDFKKIAYDIAMQVAATNPEFLKREDIGNEARATAADAFRKEVEGKPQEMQAKILEGKVNAYFADKVLLEQPFIKNPDQTISEVVQGAIQKFGEKIEVRRFTRFQSLQ